MSASGCILRMPQVSIMNLRIPFFALFLLFTLDIAAQCDVVWHDPSPFCFDATEIDFYSRCYTTNTVSKQGHPNFCGPFTLVHNPQYFYFIADDTVVQIDVVIDSCTTGAGLQAAIIEISQLTDCYDWSNDDVIACDPGFGGSTRLTAGSMVIGQKYLLLMDGSNGASCVYKVISGPGVRLDPRPPSNDSVCFAIPLLTDGSCNAGAACTSDCFTTENATSDFDPPSIPVDCGQFTENSVWFTAQMSDPNNVGFTIDITEGTGKNFSVIVGRLEDCSGQFLIDAFFCDVDFPAEFGPIFDETQVYYIWVGSSEVDEGTFSICIDEMEPCFENNYCEDQIGTSSTMEILGVVTDQGFICIDGCNLWADINTETSLCKQDQWPTVWYKVTVDTNANAMNAIVSSEDISAPSIAIYTGSCSGGLTLVPVNDGRACAPGSGAYAYANIKVAPSETYYISVSGLRTEGGNFELCVNTLFNVDTCVMSASQRITSRSLGGPLEGPFFPGESVVLCFTVQSFASIGNNCQWFQGVVPVFGNGWDLSEFDPLTDARLNNMIFPTPGIYGGTWNWYDDVHYNRDIAWYQLGDFDSNGTLDMCNSNFDPECVGPGISGGTVVGSCVVGGDVLPPGWFVSNPVGGCAESGHPDVDVGDGNGCSSTMGPWEFCMDLKVKDYPACKENETTSDLSVSFFTFSDGETGAFIGGPSICATDQPETFIYPMCCVELEILDALIDPFCSPGTFVYALDHPNVEFWEWTVYGIQYNDLPSTIVGPTDGSGVNGTNVINTIVNYGTTEEYITYEFVGFLGGDCPAVVKFVNLIVGPDIDVELSPLRVCATPFLPYELIPIVSGGNSSSYLYEWFDGTTDSILLIDSPVAGQRYSVTVTDVSGCTGTAAVVPDVYESFQVQINASALRQCLSDGPITIDVFADGGVPDYVFQWTSPTGELLSGMSVTTTEQGQWTVVAIDSEGCMGEDSILLEFWDSLAVTVSPEVPAICMYNPYPPMVIAVIQSGTPPYEFLWTTPGDVFSTSFIFVDAIGQYSIAVTDFNGCIWTDTFSVNIIPEPSADFTAEIDGDTVNFKNNSANAIAYLWDFGDGTNDISQEPVHIYEHDGRYTVTLIAMAECTNDTIYRVVYVNAPFVDLPPYEEKPPILFPNPNDGNFNLDVSGFATLVDVQVIDVRGQVIQAWNALEPGMHFINLTKIVNGVYFVKVESIIKSSIVPIIIAR
jgi:PKD domain/Secretion system C-terminal sorting domain